MSGTLLIGGFQVLPLWCSIGWLHCSNHHSTPISFPVLSLLHTARMNNSPLHKTFPVHSESDTTQAWCNRSKTNKPTSLCREFVLLSSMVSSLSDLRWVPFSLSPLYVQPVYNVYTASSRSPLRDYAWGRGCMHVHAPESDFTYRIPWSSSPSSSTKPTRSGLSKTTPKKLTTVPPRVNNPNSSLYSS